MVLFPIAKRKNRHIFSFGDVSVRESATLDNMDTKIQNIYINYSIETFKGLQFSRRYEKYFTLVDVHTIYTNIIIPRLGYNLNASSEYTERIQGLKCSCMMEVFLTFSTLLNIDAKLSAPYLGTGISTASVLSKDKKDFFHASRPLMKLFSLLSVIIQLSGILPYSDVRL